MKTNFLKIMGGGILLLGLLTTSCQKDEEVLVESIAFESSSYSLKVGESKQLKVTISPENAENKTLTWSSLDSSIASVDETGTVTAHKSGETTIQATAGAVSASCKVTAYTEVERITLDPAEYTLTEGETVKLTAAVYPEDAIDKTLTWSSKNPDVATVDSEGTVTAVKAGTAEIVASKGEVSGSSTITVKAPVQLVHPASLFAEYNVGVTPGVFAPSHDAADNGYYNFTDAQTACPEGWHIPTQSELYSVIDCYDGAATIVQHCKFTGSSNYTDVPEKILVNGEERNFTADYYTDPKGVCYALKFKDATNEYLSAYRWKDAASGTPFEVRVRWIKAEGKDLTVQDIANDDYWNNNNESDIVRQFPAVGYKYANGNSSGINMMSYCWTAVEMEPSSTGSARGLLLYFLKGNYGYTGAFAASWCCSVRCVKDN